MLGEGSLPVHSACHHLLSGRKFPSRDLQPASATPISSLESALSPPFFPLRSGYDAVLQTLHQLCSRCWGCSQDSTASPLRWRCHGLHFTKKKLQPWNRKLLTQTHPTQDYSIGCLSDSKGPPSLALGCAVLSCPAEDVALITPSLSPCSPRNLVLVMTSR